MDALLMCGGRGTRLDAPVEKPLLAVAGRPMVDRVADALAASRVETVHAVVSPHVPETRAHLDLPTVETPGEGYVADLDAALATIDPPVLTATADLPLLAAAHVDDALAAADSSDDSIVVCVPAALKRRLGFSVEDATRVDGRTVAPAGINVVADGPDEPVVRYDARLAVDVDRAEHAAIAEAIA